MVLHDGMDFIDTDIRGQNPPDLLKISPFSDSPVGRKVIDIEYPAHLQEFKVVEALEVPHLHDFFLGQIL